MKEGETTLVKHGPDSIEIHVNTKQLSPDNSQEPPNNRGTEARGQDTEGCRLKHGCRYLVQSSTTR